MLELYQFEMSHYVEKVRLILDYKGLAYRKIEVTPGLGQLEIFRLSGQRQVPVLKDGTQIVADSTAIAHYLERKFPDRPILPTDPKELALCTLLEELADQSVGLQARTVLIDTFNQNQSFRSAALPSSTPDLLRRLIGAVPGEFLSILGSGVGYSPEVVRSTRESLQQTLISLSALLVDRPYLVSDRPTLADFAMAGLSMYLKFPAGPYLELPETLKGKGVPGIADNPACEPFFTWRDRLYSDYRKPPIPTVPTGSTTPTPIVID